MEKETHEPVDELSEDLAMWEKQLHPEAAYTTPPCITGIIALMVTILIIGSFLNVAQ